MAIISVLRQYFATIPGHFKPTATASVTIPTTDLILWLDAGVEVTTISGGVSLWGDQSPVAPAGDVQQTTASLRPTVESSAINGMPALVFDGSNDELTEVSTFAASLSGQGQATWFAVYARTAETTFAAIAAREASGDIEYDFLSEFSGGNAAIVIGDGGSGSGRRLAATADTLGTFILRTAVYNGSAGKRDMYLNGVLDNGATAGTLPATIGAGAVLKIGDNGFGDASAPMKLAELLIYKRDLTLTSDFTTVTDLLMDKYAL